MDHTTFYTANYTMLPSPRKHSPEGVTTVEGVRYCSSPALGLVRF